MKIRNGFVSNSSSSSFVVAVDGETRVKLTIDVDLSKHGKVLRTIEELDALYLKEWAYGHDSIDSWLNDEEDSWAHAQYNQAKKAIENGKIVISGWFHDDRGDPIEAMLCYNGLHGIVPNNIEIIYSDGSY